MDGYNLNPVASRGGVRSAEGVAGVRGHKTTTTTKDVDFAGVVETGSAKTGGFQPYGGAWFGRYMVWWWILCILVVILIVFWLLMVFPPSWVLIQNTATNVQALDLTRLFFISVIVGLFIVLILWLCTLWVSC